MLTPSWNNETGLNRALAIVFAHEGGFSNHEADRGGKTKFGITEGVWVNYCRKADVMPIPAIEDITRADAKRVYRDLYWNPLKCHHFTSLKVATELFDTGINMGILTAGRLAQRAYNILRLDGSPSLLVDGKIGPQTLGAINKLCVSYEDAYLLALNGEQYIQYKQIVENNPSQRAFVRGWVRRTAILEP
jgi:lysozyme family protein